jgi:hypothetical protein
MPPDALKQDFGRGNDWPHLADFLEGGVKALVPNSGQPRGGQDWSAADAHAAVKEYGAPADVLGEGIEDSVKLTDW